MAIAGLLVGVGVTLGLEVGMGTAPWLDAAAGLAAGWLEAGALEAGALEAAAVPAADPANPDAALATGAELLTACGCPLVHPATRSRHARVAIDAHRLGVIWSG